MKFFNKNLIAACFFIVSASFSSNALACACGCGIFGVATSSLIPSCAGGIAFTQYDYINQSKNWNGNNRADAADNEDKQIKTQTVTVGAQYMFNRDWGLAVRVPYVTRLAKMAMMHDGEEMIDSSRVNSVGDIRINGIYSGFFDDMSTGVTFGLKLPTGKSNAKAFDARDMQIGTGTTDALLGAYHMGKIDGVEKLSWFVQGNWQHTLVPHNGYKTGQEFSGATGISYNVGSFAMIKKVAPIMQITGSKKYHDSGFAANQQNSGYAHSYFAPAIELDFGQIRSYFDVEFPIYQNTNGNQLVANRIYKFIVGYNF